eukprot:536918-Rhodomonas_salina.1
MHLEIELSPVGYGFVPGELDRCDKVPQLVAMVGDFCCSAHTVHQICLKSWLVQFRSAYRPSVRVRTEHAAHEDANKTAQAQNNCLRRCRGTAHVLCANSLVMCGFHTKIHSEADITCGIPFPKAANLPKRPLRMALQRP